jgi:ferric-dicitrate binding protein FerR (iron transport regulator)
MENHIVNDENTEIIVRYLDKRLNPLEVEQVELRLRTDADFAKEFQECKYIWNVSAFPWQDDSFVRSDKEWDWKKIMAGSSANETSTRLRSEHRPTRFTRTMYHVLRMAAIVLFMVVSSVAVNHWFFMPQSEDIHEIVFREIFTDRSQRASVQLSDGTKVNLSVDSRIKMPDVFARDVREVELTGEAYFDVAHSPDRPFIIRSGNAVIRVLGTDFGVRAYPEEDMIKVVVKSGSVAVSSNSGTEENAVVLKPGQLARVSSETHHIATEWVNPDDYLGWISGKLSFNQSAFAEVIGQIERWYDLEVILEDKSILDRRLTAVIDSRSLLNVMNVISQSIDLQYEVIDNKIFIRNNQQKQQQQ